MSNFDKIRRLARTNGRSNAKTFVLAAGLGMAMLTGVHAQDATTPPAAPQPEAPQPAAPPAQIELSMGQEAADGAPQIASQETAVVGQTYLAGQFEVWEQRCVKTEDGSDPCQLYQLLKDQSGGPVAEISIFNLPAGNKAAAGATVIAPLETLLTANLQISIDAGKAMIRPFSFCAPIGCFATIGLTDAEVDQLRKGAGAVMTIVPARAPDQKVALNISLKGFTAGFAAVTEANAAVPKP